MSISPQIRRRNEELLQRYFDRSLSETGAWELLELWKAHPELKRSARANHDAETSLRFLARIEKEPIAYDGVVLAERFPIFRSADVLETIDMGFLDELVRLADRSPSLAKETEEETPQSARMKELSSLKPYKPEKSKTLPWLILPCLAILIAAIYFEFRPASKPGDPFGKPFRPFAVVESVLDVEWDENQTPLKEGWQLEAESVRLQSGIVQIRLKNDVRLAVRGPADFRLNTVGKIFCGQGELSATVPSSGKGFEVVTPFLSVVDLGTEFLVDVGKDGVEAHTIQGKIELNRLSEEKIELTAGNAFRLDATGVTKLFETEPNRFLTDLFVRTIREKRHSEELDRWKAERERFLATPGLQTFFDFEDDGTPGVERGRIDGARRTGGRWTDKKAYSFYRKNDSIGFRLDREMTSMTLAVSMRLDRLDRYNQVILASRSQTPGTIVWQVLRSGGVQLAVRADAGETIALYQTEPIFSRRNLGVWYELATVYDTGSREVRFYLDGEPVATLPIQTVRPIRIGEATLGNLVPEKRSASDTSLDGRIDQFMIFDNVQNPI